ncbi:hypothetical protein B296_00015658 [Ensete ventricosum]|uniref:Uncharacterized protein n=1 Tax=Ensete ventricosum TaxID=4639 RepID=A0A427ATU1_ENSVE|nr:hypothetical protein B296_00015658 [Ensete ventricosum]
MDSYQCRQRTVALHQVISEHGGAVCSGRASGLIHLIDDASGDHDDSVVGIGRDEKINHTVPYTTCLPCSTPMSGIEDRVLVDDRKGGVRVLPLMLSFRWRFPPLLTSPLPLAHPAAASTGERGAASSRSRRQWWWEAAALQVLSPLPAAAVVRVAAAAFTGGPPLPVSPPPVGGRTTAPYARLLPASGRRLSAASTRRLPLPHSRGLLLMRGRRSAAMLP